MKKDDFKKFLIIGPVVVVLAVGVIWLYQSGFFKKTITPEDSPLTSEQSLKQLLVLNLGNLSRVNLTPEAIQNFQSKFEEAKVIIEKNPDDFNGWLYIGIVKKSVGDFEGASDVWAYAGQIRPNNSTSFGNLGDLYANFLNEPQKAEAAYKKAIENDLQDYTFYSSLADVYRYKFPNGDTLYEQTMLDAIAKFPDNPNLISPLALFYRQTGQVQKAIVYYEELLKIWPDNVTAREDLAELKSKLNQ